MKRFVILLLAALLCIGCALAEDTWSCTACGTADNTGRFCHECGAPKPDDRWTCRVCGQEGNKGRFCPNCGSLKPAPTPAPTQEPERLATMTPRPTVRPVLTPEPTAVPTATPAPTPSVKVGSMVKFGSYEQDNLRNGKEVIEWLVLDVKDGKALLLSRYGLDSREFNKFCDGQTWANSGVRSWLNRDFLNEAFTEAERKLISTTKVLDDKKQHYSAMASKRVGADTTDKVFLLSYAEMNKYLGKKEDAKRCIPTKYAIARGCNRSKRSGLQGQKTSWWWLRSPSYTNSILTVEWDGEMNKMALSNSEGAIRPAIWVDAAALK